MTRALFVLMAAAILLVGRVALGEDRAAVPPPSLKQQLDALGKGSSRELKAVSDTAIGLVFSKKGSKTLEYCTYDLKGRQKSAFSAEVLTEEEAAAGGVVHPAFAAESNGNVHLAWTTSGIESPCCGQLMSAVATPTGRWIVAPKELESQRSYVSPLLLINETADRVVIITQPERGILEARIIRDSAMICLSLKHELRFTRSLNSEVVEASESITLDSANRLHFFYNEEYCPGYRTNDARCRSVYRVCNDPTDMNSNYTDFQFVDHGQINVVGLQPRADGSVEAFYTLSEYDEKIDDTRRLEKRMAFKAPGAPRIKPQPVLVWEGDRYVLIDSKGKRTCVLRLDDFWSDRSYVRTKLREWPVCRQADEQSPKKADDTRKESLAWQYILFSPDGKTLVTAAEKSYAWDFISGKPLRGIIRPPYRDAWFTPDGRSMVWQTWEAIYLYDVDLGDAKTLKLRRTIGVEASNCCVSPDGKAVAVHEQSGRVDLWNLEPLKMLQPLPGYGPGQCKAEGAKFSPDGKYLAVYTNSWVRVHDAASGKLVKSFQIYYAPDQLRSLDGHWEKDQLLTAASPDYLWALPDHWLLAKANIPDHGLDFETGRDFSPDYKLAAFVSETNTVQLIEIATGKVSHELVPEGKLAGAVKFTPGGQMVAASLEDGSIALWSARSGAPLGSLKLDVGSQ